MKVVEPGLVATDFGTRSMESHDRAELGIHRSVVATMAQAAQRMATGFEPPAIAAETIWQAATDSSPQLRYPAGQVDVRMIADRARFGEEELYERTRERFDL